MKCMLTSWLTLKSETIVRQWAKLLLESEHNVLCFETRVFGSQPADDGFIRLKSVLDLTVP